MSNVSRCLLGTVILMMLGIPSASGATAKQVRLDFDSGLLTIGDALRTVADSDSADVTASVVTLDGGRALLAPGRNGGFAADLPRYDSTSRPPRAVLSVINDGPSDDLSPGGSQFVFGADMVLDAESQGTAADNGNNLVQRGLYSDRAQYKLQVDGRRPSCRVKGDAGSLSVSSPVQVNSQDWYRLTCTRDGSTLTIRVVRFRSDGSQSIWTESRRGSTGFLTMPRSKPMSVGGKLVDQTHMARYTDQFNGLVDRVFFGVVQ